MLNIIEIEDFQEIESYSEEIYERVETLLREINGSKTRLTRDLKRERRRKLKSLREKIKKLESSKNDEYYQKKEELEQRRGKLYQERDLKLEELQKENAPKEVEIRLLQQEESRIDNIISSVNSIRSEKTNEEWLNIIKNWMEERELANYSIQILDRNYTVVGIGTHSEKVRFAEERKGTIVAVVRDGYDMSKVPEQVFSYPEENPAYFKEHNFVLYEVFDSPLSENQEYLTKQNSVRTLFGMPDDVTRSIDNMLFREYKNNLISQNKMIKM